MKLHKTKLKDLLAIWPENAIFFAPWLKKLGYSSELIFKYTKSKWLKQIALMLLIASGTTC